MLDEAKIGRYDCDFGQRNCERIEHLTNEEVLNAVSRYYQEHMVEDRLLVYMSLLSQKCWQAGEATHEFRVHDR